MTAVIAPPSSAPDRSAATGGAPVESLPRQRWPWFLAALVFVQYLAVAGWLINSAEFLIADGVERTTNAMAIALSRDPHLGAMGLYWMPVPMLVRIPVLLALRPLQAGIWAGPLTSAAAGALVIPVLAGIARRCGVRSGAAGLLIALYALNPVTIWHAANGMSESWFALCLALVLLGWVGLTQPNGWTSTGLAVFGLALGLGLASRFEFIPICAAAVAAVAVNSAKHRRRQDIAMVVVPPIVVFFFWSLASSLLAGDAFYWYSLNKLYGKTPEVHPWMPDELNAVTITGFVLGVSFMFAPALFTSIAVGLAQRSTWKPFGGLVLIVAAYPGTNWFQLIGRTGVGAMRYFGLTPLLGTVLALWVIGNASAQRRSRRSAIAAIGVAASALGVATVMTTMADPEMTPIEQEYVFFAPLLGRETPPHVKNLAGFAELAELLDPVLTSGRIVAMDSKGGWLTLYTDHPERFLIPYDTDWEAIMSDPDGRFDFVVKPTVGTGVTFGSSYSGALEAAMASFTGGAFELVAVNEAGEIWEFVPTGGAPTITSPEPTPADE